MSCMPRVGCHRQSATMQNQQLLRSKKDVKALKKRKSNLERTPSEADEMKREIDKNALKTMTIKKLNQKPKQRKRFLKAILPQRRNQKSKLLLQLLRLKQRIQTLSKLRAQTRQPLSQNKRKRKKKPNLSEEPSTQRKMPKAGAISTLAPSSSRTTRSERSKKLSKS